MTAFTSLVGQTVGPCKVESLIAEGSCGQVYRAQHERLQVSVALKVIAPRYVSNPQALGRFRREAQAAARLSHPAVARVLDLGEAGGKPFIVQELVEGENLEVRVRRAGPLDADAAVALALQLAGGLIAIHAAGLLHRDLKPANIIITDAGAKIVDFGLAKDLEAQADDPRLTSAGTLLGTPLYMAPEQIEGRELTPAADWYGLGGVLRFALTGRPPHERGRTESDGEDPREQEPIHTFLARRKLEEVPPLERDDVPDGFTTLVDRLLAIDPAQRPDGDPIQRALFALRRARRPAATPPPTRSASPWPWVAAVALVLVLGAALTLILQPTAPTPQPPARATAPPPPANDVPTAASLDDVLAQLGALDFVGARASLGTLDAATPTEEAAAAREVLRVLAAINADARLTRDMLPRPGTLDRAPRTRGVFVAFARAGLPIYIQARMNLEAGNPRGVREALFEEPDKFGDAPFLQAERRVEITLLRRASTVAFLLEVGRPERARDDLTDLLTHPSAQTALGLRVRPFLLEWRSSMDRSLGPR